MASDKGKDIANTVTTPIYIICIFLGTLFSRKFYLKNFNIKNKDNKISQGRGKMCDAKLNYKSNSLTQPYIAINYSIIFMSGSCKVITNAVIFFGLVIHLKIK